MLSKVFLLAAAWAATGRAATDWCNANHPQLPSGPQKFTSKHTVNGCATRQNRGALPPFKAWELDTTFVNTDPTKDATWVVEVTETEEKDRNEMMWEMGSWALGIAGVLGPEGPILEMGLLVAENTVDYLKPEAENSYSADLTDTINQVMAAMTDKTDRQNLVDTLNALDTMSDLARSDVAKIRNNQAASDSYSVASRRASTLGDDYALLFKPSLILRKPQAAWYLFEPMFMHLTTRMQFEMLAFTAGFQVAVETKDKRKLIDQCTHIRSFRDGSPSYSPQKGDPASLVFEWELFLQYFNTAFEARLNAVMDAPTCTNQNKDWTDINQSSRQETDIHHTKFGANYVWKDDWVWGKVYTYSPSWRADGTNTVTADTRTGRMSGSCSLTYSGTAVESKDQVPTGPDGYWHEYQSGMDIMRTTTKDYKPSIRRKKDQLFQRFQGLYRSMHKTLSTTLDMCKQTETFFDVSPFILNPVPAGNKVIPGGLQALEKAHCVQTVGSRDAYWKKYRYDDGFFLTNKWDHTRWGLTAPAPNGEYWVTMFRGLPGMGYTAIMKGQVRVSKTPPGSKNTYRGEIKPAKTYPGFLYGADGINARWIPMNSNRFVEGDWLCPMPPMTDAEKKKIAAQPNMQALKGYPDPAGPMPTFNKERRRIEPTLIDRLDQ